MDQKEENECLPLLTLIKGWKKLWTNFCYFSSTSIFLSAVSTYQQPLSVLLETQIQRFRIISIQTSPST